MTPGRPLGREKTRGPALLRASAAAAVAYAAAGWFGLLFALPPGYATPVWPASGVALGMVLAFGTRTTAGVWAGSFLLNYLTVPGEPSPGTGISAAAVIATGTAIQAALGGRIVRRLGAYPSLLERPEEVSRFVLGGGPVACLASATFGVTGLAALGLVPVDEVRFVWLTWWVGDAIGVMAFAPLVLLWLDAGTSRARARCAALTAVTAVLFSAAVLVFALVNSRENQEIRQDFVRTAGDSLSDVEGSLRGSTEPLFALERFYDVSDAVTREEFRRFTKTYLRRYPAIQALAWDEVVSRRDLARFGRRAARDGAPWFRVRRLGQNGRVVPPRPRHVIVTYAEPEAENGEIFGVDAASLPGRPEALERAKRSRAMAATAPVTIPQQGDETAVVTYLPVFAGRDVRGYLAAVFLVRDLLGPHARRLGALGIGVEAYDRGPSGGPSLLYRSGGAAPKAPFRWEGEIRFGGRHWTLRFAALPPYVAAHRSLVSWSVLAASLSTAALLGMYLLVVTGQAAVLDRLVRRRTASLSDAVESLEKEMAHRIRTESELRRTLSELEAASKKLARDARFKDRFLANMSHEVRTPLQSITGYAENLLLGQVDEGERVSALSIIVKSSHYLLRIVNDVLDISKIEAGKLELDPRPSRLSEIVSDAEKVLVSAARRQGLTLRSEASGPVDALVSIDPGRLRQVLLNVVGNGVKFTKTGGVVISYSYDPAGGVAHFRVTDTGPGLPADQSDRLFEPFVRGGGADGRTYGGTGLGLAIAKEITTALGGSIGAESREGVGSTFFFTVPCPLVEEPAAPPGHGPGPAPALPPDFGGRVLVAEDGPDNQALLAFMLRKVGIEPVMVDDGRQAVEAAAAADFDLVLLDMSMPVLDGYGAARELRENGFRGKIVAVTAHATPADVARCLEAGCDGHLAKPYRRSELHEALRNGLPAALEGGIKS